MGISSGNGKVHLVKWEEICKPLYDDGLGIRKPKLMNTTFLMKLGFLLLSDKECLWARILMEKYKCHSFNEAHVKMGQKVSSLWRAVVKVKKEV